jgi:ethanolamine ammonia-lyase large subunit
MKWTLFILVIVATQTTFAKMKVSDCAQPERWAASMVQVQLKNEGLLRNEDIDFSKTKVTLLAQEKLKKNLYKQIQKVVFVKKNGEELTAITVNDASNDECSMSGVKVYLVQKEFGP